MNEYKVRIIKSILRLFYRKSARKPMVFRPWDEWCHESSAYILAEDIVFQ